MLVNSWLILRLEAVLLLILFVGSLHESCAKAAPPSAWNNGVGLWGKRSFYEEAPEGARLLVKRPEDSWNKLNSLWGKRSSWQSAHGLWGKRSSSEFARTRRSTIELIPIHLSP
uniref:Uncharacterized protein n=1 Tax=Acrobeloides nanus TaxID=290746 RepID=A0A914D6G5_9BILA